MKIKVLLADDHNMVIDGLRAVFEVHDTIEVCRVAGNGEEVLQHVKSGKEVDVVILDMNMPMMDGITCARKLKANFPK